MTASRRLPGGLTAPQALALAAAVVAIVGGFVVWHAVERLDHAWGRLTVVDDRIAAVDAHIDARIEQALGSAGPGTDALTPAAASRQRFRADLAGLADAGGVARSRAQEVEELADTVVAGAKAHRAVDESDLFALVEAKDTLSGQALQAAAHGVDAAHRTARLTVGIVAGLVAALAVAAAVAVRWPGRTASAART